MFYVDGFIRGLDTVNLTAAQILTRLLSVFGDYGHKGGGSDMAAMTRLATVQIPTLVKSVELGEALKAKAVEGGYLERTGEKRFFFLLAGHADGMRQKLDQDDVLVGDLSYRILELTIWLNLLLTQKYQGAAVNLLGVCGRKLDHDLMVKVWRKMKEEGNPLSKTLSLSLAKREDSDQVYGDHLAYLEIRGGKGALQEQIESSSSVEEAEKELRQALRSLTDMADGNAVSLCRISFFKLIMACKGDWTLALEVVEEEKGPDALPDFVPNYSPANKRAE